MKYLTAFSYLIAILGNCFSPASARASGYTDLVNSFGNVTNIIGLHQAVVNNPDGTGNNF